MEIAALASLLVASEPRSAADRILGYLMSRWRARGGAVVRITANDFRPFAVRDLSLSRLEAARQLWEKHRRSMTEGRAVHALGCTIIPLLEEAALVGALILDAASGVDADPARTFTVALAKTLTARETPLSAGHYLTSIPAAQLQREQLLLMLETHEWNIARVARLLGLNRRTIYLRLARYDITRKRVPKTLKCPT